MSFIRKISKSPKRFKLMSPFETPLNAKNYYNILQTEPIILNNHRSPQKNIITIVNNSPKRFNNSIKVFLKIIKIFSIK